MVYKALPIHFQSKFEIAACFCEQEGRILLLNRHLHKPQGGKWGLPAGKVEEGETVDQAMLRELEEETGFKASLKDIQYLSKLYVQYTEYDFVCHLYKFTAASSSEVVLQEAEHQKFQWVTPLQALSLPLIDDLAVCIEEYYGIS